MFLKNYQIKVVNMLKQFYQTAREEQNKYLTAKKTLPENLRSTIGNWVDPVFKAIGKEYKDKSANGVGE